MRQAARGRRAETQKISNCEARLRSVIIESAPIDVQQSSAMTPAGRTREVLASGDLAFRVALAAAAALSLLIAAELTGSLLSFPADRDAAAPGEDLAAFHRAGEMARAGEAAASYDPAAFRAGLAGHQDGLLWLNPPHALLAMAPLSALPYGAAKILWLALTALSFAGIWKIAGSKRRWLLAAALLSPAMLIAAMLLQLGAFVAVGTAAALALAPNRPIVSGVILALLTMKPQYGLMAPVFLIAAGHWRAIIAAAVVSAALVILSAAIFGGESWIAFLASLSEVHAPFARQLFKGTATFGQTAGKLGGGDAMRLAAQLAGIGICSALTWFAARRLPRPEAIAVALLATLAAAPSAWIYDWAFIVAAVAFLGAKRDWSPALQLAAALAWVAPLAPLLADDRMAGLAAPLSLYAFCLAAAAGLFPPILKRALKIPSLRKARRCGMRLFARGMAPAPGRITEASE